MTLYRCLQALKKFSFFNKSQNYEDAQEAYTKAGNCFKVQEGRAGDLE